MNTLTIGLLAEDETDCKTIAVLIRRVASALQSAPLGIRKYWGKGCAKLRQKAASKLKLMVADGCRAAVLVHDLDRNPHSGHLNDEIALRAQLESTEVPRIMTRLICIPVEELEAWFWADPAIIQEIGRREGKATPSPHLIKKPKEQLIRLSAGANKKPRYSTADNHSLAERLNLDLCARSCPAFRQLQNFTCELVGAPATL